MTYRYQCTECGVHSYYSMKELKTSYGHPISIQESLYCDRCAKETEQVNRIKDSDGDSQTDDTVI